MDREAKNVKAKAGAKLPAARRARPPVAFDERSVEQRLADALAQQAATSEILRVMSTSPTDVQPVLDAVARLAARLCHAPYARVLLAEGDVMRPLAQYSAEGAPTLSMNPVPLDRTSVSGRAALDRATVHHADIVPLVNSEFPGARANAKGAGFRAVLAVPLIHEGNAYGALFLWRREPGLFTPDQVALVETFATQAAIAIENVRQFRATQDALEQQTATSEILRVISQSQTDVQPVFETIAASALRLCDADFSALFRFDGEQIHIGCFQKANPEATAAFHTVYPCRPSRGGTTQRAILTSQIVHIPDIHADPEYTYHKVAYGADFRSVLSVPMLRDGKPIGTITAYRVEAKPFPDSQIELLKIFADQAVIAVENVRLFNELEARNNDLTEALEQQTATSEILRAISHSPTDAQPVFETIAANALRLCDAHRSAIFRFDGELIHIAALRNLNPEGAVALRNAYPAPPSRGSPSRRAILTKAIVHIADVVADPEYEHQDVAKAADFRSVLSVPMLRDGQAIGTITVYRDVARPFPDVQVELLKTFAEQAVIAIENVRLFTELETRNRALTEALEQQTATSEILRVISGSPTDVQPVFDTIAKAALELCRANGANVFTFDGELVRLASFVHVDAAYSEALRDFYPRQLGREAAVLRAIQTRSVIAIPDVLEDEEYRLGAHAPAGGFRSVLAVPLMREGNAIGGIAVGRSEPGRFSDGLVALLRTFADQAVIAVENVRLFTELETRNRALTEALEQQTATSDILRVISGSPTDVQPVFDTIAGAALRLCGASSTSVFTFDGELVHLAAFTSVGAAGAETLRRTYPRPANRDNAASRAVLTRNVVAIPDVLEDAEYVPRNTAMTAGFRSVLSVPLLREGNPIGAISVGRPEPGLFPDEQIALLRTFADQAVIAIENVRLFKELEARTTQLTRSVGELKALGEVGQAVSSTLDLETVLSTIVSRATQLAGMNGGAIYEYDEVNEAFHLRAADRLPDDLVATLRAAPIKKGEGALGRMAETGEPVQIRDIMDERSYPSRLRKVLVRLGYRSLLAVPLMRDDHLLGGLSVNRASPGEFDADVIDLLKTFATQSALAIQNARLFREIEVKGRLLEIASRHKSEFLANMSHELRTPLNAIIGFSEVLGERLFGEMNDKQAEYVADITESGRHLLLLINDILDLSKIEAGRMELDTTEFDLAATVDNTLTLVRERAQRRGIALRSAIDDRVTAVNADERKVKQVLLNLLSNALKFTPEGGAIDVRVKATDGQVEISVTDTGIGISPGDLETVFEEFRQVGTASKKIEGTGLGLAISRKFIELHGGKIWVTSEVGAGSTFAFSLPRR